jgi:hypothetical protein
MRTKKSLIEQINKFPDDAKFHAYQGKSELGIMVSYENNRKVGFIDCSEELEQEETQLFWW